MPTKSYQRIEKLHDIMDKMDDRLHVVRYEADTPPLSPKGKAFFKEIDEIIPKVKTIVDNLETGLCRNLENIEKEKELVKVKELSLKNKGPDRTILLHHINGKFTGESLPNSEEFRFWLLQDEYYNYLSEGYFLVDKLLCKGYAIYTEKSFAELFVQGDRRNEDLQKNLTRIKNFFISSEKGLLKIKNGLLFCWERRGKISFDFCSPPPTIENRLKEILSKLESIDFDMPRLTGGHR